MLWIYVFPAGSPYAMSHRNQLLAIAIVTAVIIGATTAVTAHDWQNEVEQGEMVLGVSTSPGTPIAGLETEFSGSITDNAAEAGQANRTD